MDNVPLGEDEPDDPIDQISFIQQLEQIHISTTATDHNSAQLFNAHAPYDNGQLEHPFLTVSQIMEGLEYRQSGKLI